jgi:monovalent cation/proton antiporter MnhG/PhaG subunit
MSARSVIATVLLVGGVGLQAVACLGLVAMRDSYDRLHYPAPAAFGALLVALAVVVQESFSLIGDKALVSGLFLTITGPVLVHATARMARVRQYGEWRIQADEPVEVQER